MEVKPTTPNIPKEFIPIEDAREIESFLKEATLNFSEVSLWTKNREIVLKSKILDFDAPKTKFTVFQPDGFQFSAMKTVFDQTGSTDCFFNLFLPKASLLFRANFQEADDYGLSFHAPVSVFRLQRRKSLRVLIPFQVLLKLEFPDPLETAKPFRSRVLDLSEGGLSFVADELNSAIFTSGFVIQKMKFSLIMNMKTLQVEVDAVVRHAIALPLDSQIRGYKIGVEFTRVGPQDQTAIRDFVLSESQKILVK